jgi:RNA-directed DNA polymerase
MIIADTLREELAAFPRKAGITPDDLKGVVAGIDWRSDGAAAVARQRFARHLDEAIAAADALARKKGVAPDQLWRNLIASAGKTDEGCYRILLDHAKRNGLQPLGPSQGNICKALAPADATSAAVIDFLRSAGPPSAQLLDALVPGQRVARFRHFAQEAVRRLGGDSSRLASHLLRGASKIFGGNRPDRALSHATDFLAQQAGSARLSLAQFSALGDPLRGALLDDAKRQARILQPAALARVRALRARARSLGLQGPMPSLDEALERIAAGKLDDPRVLPALALWPLGPGDLTRLERTIRRLPSWLGHRDNPRLVRWLSRQQPEPALLALSLLAQPHRRWAEAMQGWDDATAASAVSLLGQQRVAAVLVGADGPPKLLRRFLALPGFPEAVLRASGSRLSTLMSSSTMDPAFDRSLTRLLRLVVACDPLGQHYRAGHGLGISARRVFVGASPLTLRRFLSLPALRSARRKHPLIDALAGTALRTWHSKVRLDLEVPRNVPEQIAFDLYLQSLEANPDLLAHLPVAELAPEELDLVFTSRRRKVQAFARSLLEADTEEHRRVMNGYLAHRAAAGRGLPEFLWRFLRRRPAYLDDVLLRYPALPDARAVALLPLERLLPVAFRNQELARRLEAVVPRETLLALLPRVQARPKRSPRVRAARELALSIGLDLYPFLLKLAWQLPPVGSGRPGHAFAKLYRTYKLPKKSGGKRTITVPQDGLKALQRRILDQALQPLPISHHATGFRRGLSIVDNARAHTGAAVVVNVDIRQCFPNTRFTLIQGVAARVADGKLSPLAAWFLAEVMSFRGALPTGAPTSPAVLNVALAGADRAIGKACERRAITYTRYADDLTFSGGGKVTDVLPFVTDVLRDYGFELDEKKTNIFRRGRRQVVTGLVVNERPNLVRTLRRRLRAAVHHRVNGRTPFWHGKPIGDGELLGRIAFLGQTQPAEAAGLRAALGAVLGQG